MGIVGMAERSGSRRPGFGRQRRRQEPLRCEGKDNWWDALLRRAWRDFERVEHSQDWFEVYEIRPGIFAIYERGQFEQVISYLIVGSEKATTCRRRETLSDAVASRPVCGDFP